MAEVIDSLAQRLENACVRFEEWYDVDLPEHTLEVRDMDDFMLLPALLV